MNTIKKTFSIAVTLIIFSLSAKSQISAALLQQSDSLQKVAILKERHRQDSLLKIVMRDSLGLTDQTITQIFSAKENFTTQSEQIRQNAALSPSQKRDALHALLIQTDSATRELMGSAYKRYAEVMASRRD
jgi:hypothetical protein